MNYLTLINHSVGFLVGLGFGLVFMLDKSPLLLLLGLPFALWFSLWYLCLKQVVPAKVSEPLLGLIKRLAKPPTQ